MTLFFYLPLHYYWCSQIFFWVKSFICRLSHGAKSLGGGIFKDTSRAIVVDIFKLTLGWAFPKLGLQNPTMLAEARREIVPGLSSVEEKGPSNIDCHTLLSGTFFTKKDTQEARYFLLNWPDLSPNNNTLFFFFFFSERIILPPSHFVCPLFYFGMS